MATFEPGEVQGNILGGFLKDQQIFMMLAITDAGAAREWIRTAACNQVATVKEVATFNDLFKAIRARRSEHAIVKATWMNIAFTRAGLTKLGVSAADLQRMDPSFTADLVAQAKNVLGDVGQSAPEAWHPVYRDQRVDAVIILASDELEDLAREEQFFTDEANAHGFEIITIERGQARSDRPGHEHFGFRDGISQPHIAEIDGATVDGLPAWDFIVNATDNVPAPPPPPPPGYPPQPAPPPTGPPEWTHQGSYLVFRRLRQMVAEWRDFVEDSCPAHLSADRFAAKLVGRYEDGAPYEKISTLPAYDPDHGDPGGTADATKAEFRDAFDYSQDAAGMVMPRAAHIRKTNPRDPQFIHRRILRRGIAYGQPYDPEAADGSPRSKGADRGLLFACYQRSIADQFEFIQQNWANKADFPPPAPPPGVDVLIGQPADGNRFVEIPETHATARLDSISAFVQTTGMLYCFQPSISALKMLGS